MRRAWGSVGTMAYWLCWPGLALVVPLTRRVRVRVIIGGEVLVVRSWFGDGGFGLPGGGIRRHETALEAASRELREETGISCKLSDLRPLGLVKSSIHRIRYSTENFELILNSKPNILVSRRLEIIEYRWFKIKNYDS